MAVVGGNMVFEGQRGLFPHLLATTTNGTSGNATFGMTSGTNGLQHQCTPGLWRPLDLRHERDARQHRRGHGQGPGRSARRLCRAARRGSQDRAHFAQVTQQHFGEIFASKDATGEQVLSNTLAVMSRDGTLARYAKQPA